MAQNIEIKARVADLATLERKVIPLATGGPVAISQDDSFFNCAHGRLKLRTFSEHSAELIFYQRPNLSGPKTSSYQRVPINDPTAFRTTLTDAYGQCGRVIKQRTLYLIGRTRVHLDRVEGLGDFMELEVVLADGEAPTAGIEEAQQLIATLEIAEQNLIEQAYVDLLNRS